RYNLHLLVYFETADTMRSAIEREKQIKSGSRRRTIRLIENMNPDWRDLYRFVSD
ncbi:MAG: GIY-YIG nuclease family protein, partial [Pseudomonadota bacterium]